MQSKKESRFEVICNIGSGMVISTIYWQIAVVPQMDAFGGYDLWWIAPFVTAQFTIISIVRSYFWRRTFNKRIMKWHNEKIKGHK